MATKVPKKKRPLEEDVIAWAIQAWGYERNVTFLTFEACRGSRTAMAMVYEQAVAEILRKPYGILLYRQQTEGRFTQGGGYRDSGLIGQADIGGFIHPGGVGIGLEAKRDAKAKQSPLQTWNERLMHAVGARYHVFHSGQQGLDIVRAELAWAKDQAEMLRRMKEEKGKPDE